jgi:hypothetical protein
MPIEDNPSTFRPPGITETAADRFVDPQTFCRLHYSPMLGTGVLLGLLQEHYGDPSAIEDPLLQQYIWRSGDTTAIMIETCTNDAISRIQMRPAILVRRNAMQIHRLVMNDQVTYLQGDRELGYLVALEGTHTVFCVAGKPGHAEILANETLRFLLMASPVIRQALCFHDFLPTEVGEISTFPNLGGQYVVPVTFRYKADYPWSLAPDAPVLRHIEANIHVGAALDL